jgi:hypothetical protein
VPDKPKEEIGAEFSASERDKALANCKEPLHDYDEFELMLRAAEAEIWQPHWSYNDPLHERLRRIGMGKEAIQKLDDWIDAVLAIISESAPPLIQNDMLNLERAELAGGQLFAELLAKTTAGWRSGK